MTKFILLISWLVIFNHVHAINYSQDLGKKGYWNYEVVVQTETTTATNTYAIEPLPSTTKLMEMHPDELEKLTKDWRRHAIYTLKPQDVSEYLRIQHVNNQKARGFAGVVGFVNQTNPDLTLSDEIPITNSARQARFNVKEKTRNAYLANSTKSFGLLYFRSNTCEFCIIQDGVLSQLLTEFDFNIKTIDINRDPAIAARFAIKQTPSLVIVSRNSKNYLPVAFGATSLTELKENVYRAIRYIRKEIEPAQFFTHEQDINTGLDPLK